MFCISCKISHMLRVLLFVFPTLPMGFGSMLFNRWHKGWSPVLFRVMQGITAFYLMCPLYLLYFLIGLHFNHLFG
jgi:hypothetical protein